MAVKVRHLATAAAVDANADQYRVRTRDGTHLATDVYLPAKRHCHPAILVRTPYDKCSRYTRLATLARHYNEHGYVFVAQDSRGKFRSEGETIPYLHDAADSYDTLDWIVDQAWSNGTVGLLGASYPGFIVWAGVASGHPAVKAAVAQVTGTALPDLHLTSRWQQEVPSLFAPDDLIQIWTVPQSHYLDIDYGMRPVDAFEEALAAIGSRSRGLDLLLENCRSGGRVNPYGDRHPYLATNIPILHWIEWYDSGLAASGLADFKHFRSRAARRSLHHLRAGSGDHSGFRLEDVPLGAHNDPGTNDRAYAARCQAEAAEGLAFFDRFLRGAEVNRPQVRWHLGHVGWRSSDEWPPPTAIPTVLFLVAGASNTRSLALIADRRRSTVRWVHDPANPVPSTTSQDHLWELLRHYPDERHLAHREDVIAFSTEPLSQSFDIAGGVVAALAVGTRGHSMHLFVKLQDVHPDGTVSPVTRGQSVLNQPNPEVLSHIELQEVAYRYRAGHRMRLHIASSDYPYFLVHPGTDENPWFAGRHETREHHLVTGGMTPSRLIVHSLPMSREVA